MKRKQRSMQVKLTYVALAGVTLAGGGCLAAAAGAAGGAAVGYVYYKGKVTHSFNAGFNDTWAATQQSLAELGMPVLQQERQPSSGWIESRTNAGDRVRIALDQTMSPIPMDGVLTQVGVRVATFGDEPLSERLLSQIGAHLVARPPLAPGTTPTWGPGIAPPQPPVKPAGFVPETREPPLLNQTPAK
jgi:hypothetical protein